MLQSCYEPILVLWYDGLQLPCLSSNMRIRTSTRRHQRPPNFLLPATPHPLLILFPLPFDIPKPPPTLSLSANPAIQSQKRIRVAFAQHLFALPRVLALWVPSLAGNLTRPLRILYRLQRRKGDDDAERKEEDGYEELDGDVVGEWGRCEGRCVFVGRVYAGVVLAAVHQTDDSSHAREVDARMRQQ